ncbi:MAG: NapC/NirT family cytochrome c [Desulfobacterales bacterium]|nr:NapC/NirT family cytochrome c [Desulfobacterales bacterium]
MKKFIKPAIFIAIGVLIAFPIFSLTYYTMVRTSTPAFCTSCHEIRPAYDSWKTSTHVNNAQGFTADCMDCHLPAPQDTFNFFYAKTAHGIKDVFAHFVGGPYDREYSRNHAYETFKNAQCQKCHRNILHIPDKRGAMLAHRTVIYPKKGYEKKCVDCHKNLVHVDRDVYQYKGRQQPYRGLGI